jgi:hypothetical protein
MASPFSYSYFNLSSNKSKIQIAVWFNPNYSNLKSFIEINYENKQNFTKGQIRASNAGQRLNYSPKKFYKICSVHWRRHEEDRSEPNDRRGRGYEVFLNLLK